MPNSGKLSQLVPETELVRAEFMEHTAQSRIEVVNRRLCDVSISMDNCDRMDLNVKKDITNPQTPSELVVSSINGARESGVYGTYGSELRSSPYGIQRIPDQLAGDFLRKSVTNELLKKLVDEKKSEKMKDYLDNSLGNSRGSTGSTGSKKKRLFTDEKINSLKKNNYTHSYPDRYRHIVVPNKDIDPSEPPNVVQNCELTRPIVNIRHTLEFDISDFNIVDNSNVIPTYYLQRFIERRNSSINIIDTINDSIRNLRKLNDYQLQYIKEKMSDDEKYKLICLYNEVFTESLEMLLAKSRTGSP